MKNYVVWNWSVLIVLLFYEVTGKPWSDSVNKANNQVGGGGGDEDNSPSQVPVWARKAGFHLKPRIIEEEAPEFAKTTLSDITMEQDQRIGLANPNEMTKQGSEYLSSFSQRDLERTQQNDADGNDDKKMQNNKPFSSKASREKVVEHEQHRNKNEAEEISQEDEEDDSKQTYYDDEYEDEEPECRESQYWHIRGKRCVPVHCPGGNNWRDVHTGECILRKHRGSGKWRKKYSARFGIPSKTVTGLMNGRWVSG